MRDKVELKASDAGANAGAEKRAESQQRRGFDALRTPMHTGNRETTSVRSVYAHPRALSPGHRSTQDQGKLDGVAALQAPAPRSTHALALRHTPRSRLALLTRSGIPEAHKDLPLRAPLPYLPRTRSPSPMFIASPHLHHRTTAHPRPRPSTAWGRLEKLERVFTGPRVLGWVNVGRDRHPSFSKLLTPRHASSNPGSLSVLVKPCGGP